MKAVQKHQRRITPIIAIAVLAAIVAVVVIWLLKPPSRSAHTTRPAAMMDADNTADPLPQSGPFAPATAQTISEQLPPSPVATQDEPAPTTPFPRVAPTPSHRFTSITTKPEPRTVAFNFRFPYYTCVLPRQIECPIVGTEADKKTKCADCVLWETRFVDQRVAPTLDVRRYTYRPNRRLTASYLISDLTKEIAALKDPEDGAAPRLQANSFDSIRKNPEYHDLLQVEFGQRTDAILISPSMGGAALWKSEPSTQTLGSSIDNYALWYVSDAEKGKLTFTGNATDVFRSADIRAFAPLSLVRAAESSAKPSVFWNVRATKPAPQGGGTATTLDIGFEYQVVFTLEHLLRQKELGGTLGSKQGLLKWIEDNFLNEVPGDPVFVNIILLTDDHVEVLGSRVAHVELEVDEIRRWLSEKVAPDEVKPFLRATFKVRALRSGTVPMTVAMWDDYGRPIDDFRTAAICVHACSATTPLQPASLGIDSARAAAAGATPPDLSIQLLQVGDDVFGMLHRRDTAACPEDYCIWRVASSLRTYLADLKSATDGFAAAMTGNDRLIAGKKLRDVLFPRNAETNPVREAFEQFLAIRGGTPYALTYRRV